MSMGEQTDDDNTAHLTNGRCIDLPDDRSVLAWRWPDGKSWAFEFRNGEAIQQIRLSNEAIDAIVQLTSTPEPMRWIYTLLSHVERKAGSHD